MKPFFDLTLPRGGDHVLSGPVAIILGLGIIVAVAIAQTIQAIEVRRAAADFQLAAEQTINSIEDRVDSQIELIRSVVSFFSASSDVTRGDFQSFVADSLRRHPSIQIVGWVPRISAAERAHFEDSARQEGLTNFRINERSVEGRAVTAAMRPEYFPNMFVEPPPTTESTYGLDQGSELIRRNALESARDTGDLVFSARTELPLIVGNRTAIIAYAPIYRDGGKPTTIEQRQVDLTGFAYGAVRPARIIEEMLDDRFRGKNTRIGQGMRIDVFDTTDTAASRFLFFYKNGGDGAEEQTRDAIVTGKNDFVSTASFGGREWTFVARPSNGALTGTITWQTGLAFGATLCLSLLLAAYMHTVLNKARSIEAEVGLRTNELRLTNELLRNSEDRIRVITNSVPALIAYIDRNLVYRFVNQRYADIGIDPETLIGTSLADRRQDGSYDSILPFFERAKRGEAVSFEITPRGKNGETLYRAITCTPDITENGDVRGFYVLGRDITAERNAENEIKHTYDLLRSSEERLRVITNSLPALIAHVDDNMCIQYLNERFANLMGVDPDHSIGRSLKEVVGFERYGNLRVACERALQGEASQLEVNMRTADGRQICILTDFTPDARIDGKISGFYFVALNVTAQRALEIELDRFFRQSLSFMCVVTYDGFLRRFNDTWSAALGYTNDELISTPFINFIHPDDHMKFQAAFQRLETEGDVTNLETRMLHKDGAERFILWNAAANKPERQIYATGHDITEIKAVDRMKDEFVSTVSHELRTPLTSIKGALGLMRAKTLGTLPADMNMMLEIAYKNCDRLVLLINDILDIEKIEAGKMDFHFEPVDLVTLAKSAVAANQAYADQFSIKFDVEIALATAMIRADEGRIMQVMANLLSNAAKFSPEHSDVKISVARRGRVIRVAIEDHGPGITDEFRGRIFEKFSQNDSSDRRKVNGTGLGLSIVRAIVERHGGQIDFDSELGKGSTFYFDLPEIIANHPISESQTSETRILICEDDPDIAEILRGIIEKAGHTADIALSAAQAKALLDQNVYAGMTLDIVLPDMNGVEFFKQLRANSRTFLLPIIIISAKAAESAERINGSAINVVDWLDKPFDEDRLSSAVRAAIAMSVRSSQRILHIEDDSDLLQIVSRQAGPNISFVSAGSLAAARQLLGRDRFDLVILDLILPDGRGEELLPFMVNPDGTSIPVIIFSALEVPLEIAQRVEAVLVKTRSTDQMLTGAIDSFIMRHNQSSPSESDTSNTGNTSNG